MLHIGDESGLDHQTTLRRVLIGPLSPNWVASVSEWLQALGAELGLAPDDRYRVELCGEEVTTNVVKYSAARAGHAQVELHALIDPERLTLVHIDPGAAFDPLSVPAPPPAGNTGEIQLGSQGIRLLRSFCDDCAYARRDGSNRLELGFRLHKPVGATLAQMQRRALGGLAAASIFAKLPLEMLEPSLQSLAIQDIAGDTVLLERGERNDAVLLILRGTLQVFLDHPGHGDHYELEAGECVGEMSVIDAQPVSAYVVASEGCRLLVIDADTLLNRLLLIPGFSRNLMSVGFERMRRSDQLTIQRTRKLMEAEHAQRELQYARAIQQSLLPRSPILAGEPRLNCVARMSTARDVGGDFYDVLRIDSRRVCFVIADVCGKGLPAALFMVRAMAVLRAESAHHASANGFVEALISDLNEQLCSFNASHQFLTAFCAELDLETNTMRYVNAGHNPPAIATAGGSFRFLEETINPMVGMVPQLGYRAGEIGFAPGSTLFMYTDGVTEAEDGAGQMLGEDRLLACLNALDGGTVARLVDGVFDEVRSFAGSAEQSDDITVMAIRRGAA